MMDDLSAEDLEMIQEFLEESKENLAQLDPKLAELEARPDDEELVVSAFRTIHTIKGACGFLGFSTLEGITVQAECLLGQVRDGKRKLTAEHLSLVHETVDATRAVLSTIEESGKEGPAHYEDLVARLKSATL